MPKVNDITCPRCDIPAICTNKGLTNITTKNINIKSVKDKFASVSLSKRSKQGRSLAPEDNKYQPCTKFEKVTFLHYDYKYYLSLRCRDKNYNHSFSNTYMQINSTGTLGNVLDR